MSLRVSKPQATAMIVSTFITGMAILGGSLWLVNTITLAVGAPVAVRVAISIGTAFGAQALWRVLLVRPLVGVIFR